MYSNLWARVEKPATTLFFFSAVIKGATRIFIFKCAEVNIPFVKKK